jgi:hypothetical protein
MAALSVVSLKIQVQARIVFDCGGVKAEAVE